ncbi:MAG: PilN domain-containing protein [Psychrobium sp.]|nr:PilN domain-containing protein [Psychrobium sp.]
MKTRINLYLEQLKPVKEKLPLVQSVILFGITILFSVFGAATLMALNYQQTLDKESLSLTIASEQKSLNVMITEFSRKNNSAPLLAEIATMKRKIRSKKSILQALDQQFKNAAGFSSLFESLASVSVKNVWLTEISSNNGLLSFKGGAVNSKDIPVWIEKLKSAPALAGHTFSALSLVRDEGTLTFSLSNVDEALAVEVAQ